VWRWRDPSGHLHYTNVRANAPRYAEPVTTQIGHASWPPLATKAAAPRPAPRESFGEPRLGFGSPSRVHTRSCWPFGYPYIVINNPHEPADQLKQASILDALGVPWRRGCCL
jgi:hypothetical protein